MSNFTGTAQFSAIKNPKFIDIQDQLAGDGGLSEKFSGARSVFKFDVAVDTLDNYVLHKLPSNLKIDLIKLDTEASEHLVLAGAESVLQNHRPIIQCEVLPGQIEKELQERAFASMTPAQKTAYQRACQNWDKELKPNENLLKRKAF